MPTACGIWPGRKKWPPQIPAFAGMQERLFAPHGHSAPASDPMLIILHGKPTDHVAAHHFSSPSSMFRSDDADKTSDKS